MDASMDTIFGHTGLLSQHLDHFEYREEQFRMASLVANALNEEQYLIVEAGTGIGKTLAYLIPAILSKKKVIISTGTKNLQEQIYYNDIPLLHTILPLPFRAAYMKGRTNYLCLNRFERFKSQPTFSFRNEISHFETISHWVHTTLTGDRSELEDIPDDYSIWSEICSDANYCLGQKCHHFKECFLTLLKQKAQQSDIIIVNHHLFFADLMLKATGYGEVIPNHDAVVFDESHQIEEIATHYFGMTVSNYRLDELVRDTLRELKQSGFTLKPFDPLLDRLQSGCTLFFQHFISPQARYRLRQDHLSSEVVTALTSLLNNLIALYSKLDTLSSKTEATEALSRRAREIYQHLTFIVEGKDPAYVYWCEVKGKGIFLKASPIDVGSILNQGLFEHQDTLIFTSATLSTDRNFSYFKNRLGLGQNNDIEELILDSHFDYTKQAILYLPHNLPAPDDQAFTLRAAGEIEDILDVTCGRAFVLFTSYRNMTEIYHHLKDRLPFTLLLQGEKPRSVLLRHFKENINSVLFATSSFWEGVDVQGEALSCVIIDKLPFDPPTEPMVEARIEYITAQGGNAFFSYQIPSAIISLKQGLGRLIRNREDRGVLSILDKRISSRSYGQQFLKSIPPYPITRKLSDIKAILT